MTFVDLLEDEDGAPYPDEVQKLVRWVEHILSEVHLDDYRQEARETIAAAVESVALFETPAEEQQREARGGVLMALMHSEWAGDAGKIRAVVMPAVYDLLSRSGMREGAYDVVVIHSDPSDLRASMTVGTLLARTEGRDTGQVVVMDTGNGRDQLLPVYAMADDEDRVVLEL